MAAPTILARHAIKLRTLAMSVRAAMAREASTSEPANLMDIVWSIFGPDRGLDLDLPSRGAETARPAGLVRS